MARFDKAMEKAATSKQNTLKTTQAVEAVEDEALKEKLRGLQKKQIAAAGGPEGDWLVLADRSPSMEKSIEYGKHVAAALTQFVKGKVYLVFFDEGADDRGRDRLVARSDAGGNAAHQDRLGGRPSVAA